MIHWSFIYLDNIECRVGKMKFKIKLSFSTSCIYPIRILNVVCKNTKIK